jgi:ABC-type multidrug transport system permease subunit
VAIINFSLGSMASLPAAFAQRAVFYRQRDASFFPTSAYGLASMLMLLPVQILEVTVFSTIVYFSVGLSLSNGGEPFFFWWLMCLAVVSTASGLLNSWPWPSNAPSCARIWPWGSFFASWWRSCRRFRCCRMSSR